MKIEQAFWIAALLGLFIMNPSGLNHLTLCPLALSGLDFCPGCGLGRSISFLLHGDLQKSIHMHMLGIPALLIIVYRIYHIFKGQIC